MQYAKWQCNIQNGNVFLYLNVPFPLPIYAHFGAKGKLQLNYIIVHLPYPTVVLICTMYTNFNALKIAK